jgi:hypothetical protein
MKKLFTLLIGICFSLQVSAQSTAKTSDDGARIVITSLVPDGLGGLTPTAQKALKVRLDRIITGSGVGGSSPDNRFVMAAKIIELTKDISTTTPKIYTYTLEVTLIIGDAIEGTKFSSLSFEQRGAGNSETKAYISAIRGIKSKSSKYTDFIAEGKSKITDYYNSKCGLYLKEAETFTAQDDFQAAIAKLTSIPQVCEECYNKAVEAIGPIYQKQIDKQCKIDISAAKSAWSANQDEIGAKNASTSLGKIDPNSSCYGDAEVLLSTIAKRIQDLDQREWDFKLKQQQDDVDIQKQTINAARDIGVAYAENQPDVSYNVAFIGY